MDRVVKTCDQTKAFPESEKFGLTSQMRRAAISIPSNIAEGSGRSSDRDFNRFLVYTNGSAGELITQVMTSERLGFLSEQESGAVQSDINEVMKMIQVFQLRLERGCTNKPEANYHTPQYSSNI